MDLLDFNLSDQVGFTTTASPGNVDSGGFNMSNLGDKLFSFWQFSAVTGAVTGQFQIQTQVFGGPWITLKSSPVFLLAVNGYVAILHKSEMPAGHTFARVRLVLAAGTSVALSNVTVTEMDSKPDPIFHKNAFNTGWLQADQNGNPRVVVEASPEKND